MSTGFSENSHTAESYEKEFMMGLYDLFRSEDKDNYGHITYNSMRQIIKSLELKLTDEEI